jgi:hypothetical protein
MNCKDMEGSHHYLFKILFLNLPGRNEEDRKSLRVTDVSVDIRKRNFWNTYGTLFLRPCNKRDFWNTFLMAM